MKIEDSKIIDGIKNCDNQVLEHLYYQHFPSICQFIVKNKGDEDEAKDVFQDTMNLLYTKIINEELKLNVGFGTYLFSVSKFLWFNELRRKQKQKPYLFDEQEEFAVEDPAIFPAMLKVERQALFLKHLDKLSEECKTIMELFAREISNDEMKEKMGYKSIQYTKNRKIKCFEKLMNKISADPTYKEVCNEKI